MDIVNKDPAALTPYENNTKTHPPEQVDRIAESIKRFGWWQPIVADRDNVVIIGHGRLLAAKQLMLDTVPVVYADTLTDDQIQALRIADNKTNESPWDFAKLEEELAALSIAGVDMTAFGFDDLAAEDETDTGGGDEPNTPDVPEEPKAKRGEVYRLGAHALMCGDSASPEDVQKLTGGAKAALLLTDPPYGIDKDKGIKTTYGTNAHNAFKYQGDWDGNTPTKEAFDYMLTCAENAVIFGANYFTDKLPCNGAWIVWDKVGEISFQNPFSDCELAWTSFRRDVVKKYTCIQQGFVADEKEKRVHPTQKPVRMLAGILEENTQVDDIVLDLFGGSGSTLMACEQTGRKCFMMELDPHYVDVIIKRWEDYTGQQAELIQGVG